MSTVFTLRVIKDNHIRRFDLLPGDVSALGRSVESNIHIPDPSISRHQATLRVLDDHVDVEMNPESPNELLKNGRHARRHPLFPGDCASIGPYRFELEATTAEPVAAPNALPPDPAGPIDLSLAEEQRRIAPRWSTTAVETSARRAPDAPDIKKSALRRLGLPAAAAAVAGLCGWIYLREPPGAGDGAPARLPSVNLLAAVQSPNCGGEEACVKLARDRFEVAEKLRQSGARDLVTLYRAAKLLHQAQLALDGRNELFPELADKYRRAQSDLGTVFTDLQFRAERARVEHDPQRQMAALKSILALCEEDRLPMCVDQERVYQQLKEGSQE